MAQLNILYITISLYENYRAGQLSKVKSLKIGVWELDSALCVDLKLRYLLVIQHLANAG